MSELDELIKERKRNRIKNGIAEGEFYQESEPICPHCGKVDKYWWEHMPNEIDEWQEINCGECEKNFKVKIEHVYSTRVSRSVIIGI